MANFLAVIESEPKSNGKVCQALDKLLPPELFQMDTIGTLYAIRSIVEIPINDAIHIQAALELLVEPKADPQENSGIVSIHSSYQASVVGSPTFFRSK